MTCRVRERNATLQDAQPVIEFAEERVRRSGEGSAQYARIHRPAEALALEVARKLLDDAQADVDAAIEIAECMVGLHETAASCESQPKLLVLLGGRESPFGALLRALMLAGHPKCGGNLT